MVQCCTTVHVRREGNPRKFPARVVVCAINVDLALLTVDDPSFWTDLQPLELVDVPHLQDSVVVVGFPVGGDSVCVTKGVVSRVSLIPYFTGGHSLLTVQIDAAINPGNSGGPAFSDVRRGKVVGVAFSKLKSGDSIGFIIAAPVVRHFVAEWEAHGRFRGVPARGFSWQKMENVSLRARHALPPDASGVLLNRLDPLAPCTGPLRARDILLAVEGRPVADDGTVTYRGHERLDFTHLWRERHVGDTLRVTLLRDGARCEAQMRLAPAHPLVPIAHGVGGCYPSYFVIGGLVFLPLSVPFLEHAYGSSWRKLTPVKLQALISEYRHQKGKQVVLLFQILAAELNHGYRGTSLWITHFNDQPVCNLAQMASLVDAAAADQLVEYLEWKTDDENYVVLNRAAAVEQSAAILKQHAIAHDRSADLRGEVTPADWDEEEEGQNGGDGDGQALVLERA